MDDHCNNFFHRVLRGGTSVGKREREGGGGVEREGVDCTPLSPTHPPTPWRLSA